MTRYIQGTMIYVAADSHTVNVSYQKQWRPADIEAAYFKC